MCMQVEAIQKSYRRWAPVYDLTFGRITQGGRILAETQPVVNWSLLASPKVPAPLVEKLRESLMAMNTGAAPVLGQMGVKAWALGDRKDYLELLAYTQE